MKRFTENSDDRNNVKRFTQGYGDTSKSQKSSTSQDIYGHNVSQYYSGSQLNKDQQYKYSSMSMYPLMKQQNDSSYYNSYFNTNQNWRYQQNSNISATTTTMGGGSGFVYDPTQPPPPLPKLNKPPPPLPPGEPPYYSSRLSIKSPVSINSTPPPPLPPTSPTLSYPSSIDSAYSSNNSSRRLQLTRGGGAYRGNKRNTNAYTFNRKGRSTFKSTSQNGQDKTSLSGNSRGPDPDDDGDDILSHIQVNKKAKRKPMSTRYPRKIEWDRNDALKALALEKDYNKLQRNSMLILKFPDPELNKNIVKEYSPGTKSVHFQQPSTPRYCFVQLKKGSDIEKVREELCQIKFGNGYITAERKRMHSKEEDNVR